MICWAVATVESCLSHRKGLQKLAVRLDDGVRAKAYHYTDAWREVKQDDRVVLNTTAVELALGSGGFHFVYCILPKGKALNNVLGMMEPAVQQGREMQGHLMKLRYTPSQRAVLAVEEQASPHHAVFKHERKLAGLPVLIGELHSMLPIAMCWLRHVMSKGTFKKNKGEARDRAPLNIVYIASDGGALPLTLSDHVATLNELGWLRGTITYGQAYGGDLEAMNKYTALIAAKHIFQADIVLVAMGPGIAGTGTLLGHTGVEVGELINAVSVLEGTPIVIPRISFAEQRERHQGLSHHTLSSLHTIALRPAIFPLSVIDSTHGNAILNEQIEQYGLREKHDIRWVNSPSIAEMEASFIHYPLAMTTMGRTLEDDPAFFRGVCSAAQVAYEYCLD